MADSKGAASIRNAEAVREILGRLCSRSGLVILATPYMRFESSFLRLDADRVQCHATMDLDDAKFGLRSPDLRMRFPSGRHFLEGSTRLLGLGRANGRQSLELAIPAVLDNGDARSAYRVAHVGRVPVTLSNRKYELLQGRLMDLSTTGLAVHLLRDVEASELRVGDRIHVDFTLAEGPRVNVTVEVRHLRERMFGAEFRPALADPLLETLSQWVFKRREEDVFGLEPGAGGTEAGAPVSVAGGEVILVSSSPDLGEQLASALDHRLPPLRRVAPTIQSVRELAPGSRTLVVLHADAASWEARKRLKTLVDALPAGLPRVVVGTGLDQAALYELGNELKAAWTYPLADGPGTLFPRLLLGIYRKHFPDV
jgi:hypothetical protein